MHKLQNFAEFITSYIYLISFPIVPNTVGSVGSYDYCLFSNIPLITWSLAVAIKNHNCYDTFRNYFAKIFSLQHAIVLKDN